MKTTKPKSMDATARSHLVRATSNPPTQHLLRSVIRIKTLVTFACVAMFGVSAYGEERPPIEAVPVSEASITVSPKGSAHPGKQWLTRMIKIKNTSGQDFLVSGGSLNHVFIQVYTLDPKSGEWISRELLYCGFGSGRHLVKTDSEFTASVSLPIELSERDFLIEFRRYSDAHDQKGKITRTLPLSMKSSHKDRTSHLTE